MTFHDSQNVSQLKSIVLQFVLGNPPIFHRALVLYQIFHSTETSLLKIHNDLILAMDRGEVTSLILLDLSAVFDTVNHSILLTRLQNWFGLDGLSFDWFSSYLSSRSQAVSMIPSLHSLLFLVVYPKVSYLAHSFSLYTTPLGSVISKNSLKCHLYADDA